MLRQLKIPANCARVQYFHFTELHNWYISAYINHTTWCRRHIAPDWQQERRSESSIHKHSKPWRLFYCVLCFKCSILCHKPLFSGSWPAVRCLFKQRLLQKQPKHQTCDRNCFTMLFREESWDEKPFIIMGCTSDMVFRRRSCDNKCYDEKKTFGGIEHYTCVHCCTGDKCNSENSAGFHMRSGIILTFASTTLALVKYLYF